jgi:Ca2+-binding RTX toxin-like protein
MPSLSGSGTIHGTESADVISSTNQSDGQGGYVWDDFYGEGGNDQLFGGAGYNELYGGEGDDLIDNSQSTPSAYFAGSANWDQAGYLDGGPGNDTIIGGAYRDYITGGDGNDTIDSGAGRDTVYGGIGDDLIDTGDGNDYYYHWSGLDRVKLGSGNDYAILQPTLSGIYIDDFFAGAVIDGGDGTDTFGMQTASLLALRARYNPDGSLTLWWNPAASVGLTLYNFEVIENPLIFVNPLFDNNTNTVNFNSLTSDQTLRVSQVGMFGLSKAGEGNDIVNLPNADKMILTPNVTWDYSRTFFAEGGEDTIIGSDLSDRIDGGAGNDNLAGNAGSDKLYGGDGIDELVASLNDNPGDSDYLDGGAGRDTFFVNAGDVVAAFNTDDDRIVFSTPYSVANIVVVYDSVLDDTTIRAFSDDRQVYQSILIEDGISPYTLAVRAYVGNYGSGTLIENIPLSQAIFGFGFDDQAAISGSSTALSNLIAKGIEKEIQKAMVDAGIDKIALGAFEAHVARTSAVAVAKNTSAFLAELNIYERRVEFVDSLAQIMLKFMKGQYDGNSTAFWGDFGEAMSDLCLPVAGGTIFRIGTELATKLIISSLIKWGDAATASYLQLATARTATPTTGDDVLWFDPDGSSYAFSDGNDIGFFGQSAGQFPELQNSEGNQAAGIVTNVDGGNGIDTLVYLGSENLVIDLVAGTTTHSTGTDHLSSIEKVATGSGNDTIVANAQTLALWGNGGNDRFVVSIFTPSLAIDGGDGTDTLVLTNSGSMLPALSSIEGIELTGGATLTLSGTQVSNELTLNTAVTGTGSLTINMTAGQILATKLMAFGAGVAVTVNGTSGTDIMKLGNAVQTVNGGDGTDQIKGGSLVDTINGGAGADKIMGMGGADVLTGGAGNDVFRYLNQSDSGIGATSDRITDFTIGQDRLNFSKIDTNPGLAGDQGFAFVGTAAFAGSGFAQMRYQDSGADILVQADVNGDGVADMEIVLQGLAGQVLGAGQFVL